MDVGGVDAAPVVELRANPVAAVRRGAPDVGQEDAVAARRTAARPRSMAPAPSHPAGRHGRRSRSGAGRRPAPAGEATQVSIGPPGPGTSNRRMTGHERPRAQRLPCVVRGFGRSPSVREAEQLHRSVADAGEHRDPAIGLGAHARRDDDAVRRSRLRRSFATPGAARASCAGVDRVSPGRATPDGPDDRDDRRVVDPAGGPRDRSGVQPCRSESIQLPIGRSRVGASGHGGAAPSAGPHDELRAGVVEGVVGEVADGRHPATIRRPGRRMGVPAEAEHLRWCRRRARRRPRRSRSTSWKSRSASGRGSVTKAIVVRPATRRCSRRPSRPAVTCRGRAPAPRFDDVDVRPSVEAADLVVAPVESGDPSRDGLLAARRLPAHDEPWRVDVEGEGQPAAVGRPRDLADRAVLRRPDRPRPPRPAATRERKDAAARDSSSRRRLRSRRPAAGHAVRLNATADAVGRDPRGRVSDAAGRELDRPPLPAERDAATGATGSDRHAQTAARRRRSARRATRRAPRARPAARMTIAGSGVRRPPWSARRCLEAVADAAERDDLGAARGWTLRRRRATWGLSQRRSGSASAGQPARTSRRCGTRSPIGADQRLGEAVLDRRQVQPLASPTRASWRPRSRASDPAEVRRRGLALAGGARRSAPAPRAASRRRCGPAAPPRPNGFTR